MGAIGFFTNKPATPEVPGDKDDSSYDHTFTSVGESSAKYNENSKVGTACLRFSGNDQKLTTPANSNLNLGTEFTVDFWMRFHPFYRDTMVSTNGGCKIISNYEEVTVGEATYENGYEIGLNGSDRGQVTATYWYDNGFGGTTAATITATSTDARVTDGAWHHICFQRDISGGEFPTNTIRLFVDGVSYGTAGAGSSVHNSVTLNPFTIGARATSSGIELPFLYGELDELEIIDGVAKYTTTGFTPPTTANTSTANHLLLMHFDSNNPEATIWYDTTYYAPAQYWNVQGGQVWNGTEWTSFNSTWVSQNGWDEDFRPAKMKVQGTPVGSGTISLINNDDFQSQVVIASGSAASQVTMDTDFDDDQNFHYLINMTQFSAVSNVSFDAKPTLPQAA